MKYLIWPLSLSIVAILSTHNIVTILHYMYVNGVSSVNNFFKMVVTNIYIHIYVCVCVCVCVFVCINQLK
jgi:hypothetical protein